MIKCIFAMLILAAAPTFACETPKPVPTNQNQNQNQNQSQKQNQSQSQSNKQSQSQTATSKSTSNSNSSSSSKSNSSSVSNSTNINANVSNSNTSNSGNNTGNSNVKVTEQREVLAAMPVTTTPFPLLNGRIGEFDTKKFAKMRRCTPNDEVLDIVETNDGGIFTAIRYKDLNREIIDTLNSFQDDKRDLCYWVGVNESSNGGGIGGGATGAMSSGSSFMSTGAAIVPGYNAATFDPKFFIEVIEVAPTKNNFAFADAPPVMPMPTVKPAPPVKDVEIQIPKVVDAPPVLTNVKKEEPKAVAAPVKTAKPVVKAAKPAKKKAVKKNCFCK